MSPSAIKKIATKSVPPRSCASNSVLAVGYVRRQPDAPPAGSGRPPLGAQPPETAPELPGEPPKIDLHGVDDVDEARARTPPNPPSPPTLLRYGGTAAERSHR